MDIEGFAISGRTSSRIGSAPADPGVGGGLPQRRPVGQRPAGGAVVPGGRSPVYVDPHEWNQLRNVVELPYPVLLAEAERVIGMHGPAPVVQTVPDDHARWREVVVRRPDERGTVYQAGAERCAACRDDECALLEAAKWFQAVVAPYVMAERKVTQHARTTRFPRDRQR